MARYGHTVVRHRFVTLNDDIGFDVLMLWTGDFVALASNKAAIERHGLRCGDHLAAMIGIVIETNEIHHGVVSFSTVKHCQTLLVSIASSTNDLLVTEVIATVIREGIGSAVLA